MVNEPLTGQFRDMRLGCIETAPQQTAPDGSEGIVGALAEALCECGHGAFFHVGAGCGYSPCKCRRNRVTSLAPTVARLIDDAVAERLAGVEALVREERRRDPSTYNVWSRIDSVLYAAAHADSEPYKAPESAEQASEAPGGRDESAGLSEAVCVCGHVEDEHDAGIASCGMCMCEEFTNEESA